MKRGFALGAPLIALMLLMTSLSGCIASQQMQGVNGTQGVDEMQNSGSGTQAMGEMQNPENAMQTATETGPQASANGSTSDANMQAREPYWWRTPTAGEQFFSSPVVQEIFDRIVPKGIPQYTNGTISFDKPNESLAFFEKVDGYRGKYASEETIVLSGSNLSRYERIAPGMTCEFCCGPAAMESCGCNHAAAYRGIAKYLIKNYGSGMSDEQIISEQVKWKNLWFQQSAVIKELRLQNREGELSDADLNKLITMVGGC